MRVRILKIEGVDPSAKHDLKRVGKLDRVDQIAGEILCAGNRWPVRCVRPDWDVHAQNRLGIEQVVNETTGDLDAVAVFILDRGRNVEREGIDCLVCEIAAKDKGVVDAAGFDIGDGIGAVCPIAVVAPAALERGADGEFALGHGYTAPARAAAVLIALEHADGRLAHCITVEGFAVTGDRMDLQVFMRLPFDLHGADVGPIVDEVAPDHAVEIVAIDKIGLLCGRIERVAELGHTVEAVIVIIGHDLEIVGDAQRPCNRSAVPFAFHKIAARRICVVIKAVETQRDAIVHLKVRINGAAIVIFSADARFENGEIIAELRALGLQRDKAASRAAPAENGAGAFDDFDLLNGKDFAAGDAGIAQAVDVNVAARFETTDEDAVAKRVAALARAKRHARRAAHDLAETGRADILDHFLGNDRLRLGRVAHGRGKLAVGGLVNLERRFVGGVDVDVGTVARDHNLITLLIFGKFVCRCGGGQKRCAESPGEQGSCKSAVAR